MLEMLMKAKNKNPSQSRNVRSICLINTNQEGNQNLRSQDEEDVKKIPIFPKTHLISQLFTKNRFKERKESKKVIRNKLKKLSEKNTLEIKKQNQAEQLLSTLDETNFRMIQNKQIRYINGNRIEGQWKNNLLHGFTEIQYESGQYFLGKYFNGVRTDGYVKFKDGTQYKGGFLKDVFHGEGSLKVEDGRIFTCNWQKGEIEGKVKIQYPSGDIYYGDIRNMRKHGTGYLFFANGNKYIGEFVDGKIDGKGVYYESNGEIKGEGIWKSGILQEQSLNGKFIDLVSKQQEKN